MSFREERRVQEIGGSYVVYLPKDWCREYGISKGSRLVVKRSGSRLVLELSGPPTIKVYSEISLDSVDLNLLGHTLIALYVAGAEQIKLVSRKQIAWNLRREIVSLLKNLPGFGIFDEGRNFVVLREVRRSPEMENLLRRAANGSRNILEKVIESYEGQRWDEDLEDLDSEIDAVKREAERAFNLMLRDPDPGRAGTSLAISYIVVQIVRLMERISDHLTSLQSLGEELDLEDVSRTSRILGEIYRYYTVVTQLAVSGLEEDGRARREGLEEAMRDLVKIIEGKRRFHNIIESQNFSRDIAAYHLSRIYDYITDIAEYLVDLIAVKYLISSAHEDTAQ